MYCFFKWLILNGLSAIVGNDAVIALLQRRCTKEEKMGEEESIRSANACLGG